ncbi:DUF2510 domain-containing protein [Streptomyces sp. NPDC058572]|uniref:DUF2510 domain-containing protein n=1 Tax=Streptomyces sp. NPDC058572 TaxID=3346546 RepID=UPI00364EAFA8
MSMTTPAGWYPDPNAPATERWWDGTAWTAHSRAAQAPGPVPQAGSPQGDAHGVGFGAPAVPVHRPAATPGTGARSRSTHTLALATAGVVLVAAVAAGAVLLGKDNGSVPEATGSVTPAVTATDDPEDGASESPADGADAAELVDQFNGITMPVPEGWEKSNSSLDQGTTMHTAETYECPGGGSPLCRHGRVSSLTAPQADGASAKAVAEQDIERAADEVYGEDAIGNSIHGGITSHTVLDQRTVAVAGRTGHLVRWRVTTGKGPGGYVQSVVFPSTVGTEALVMVRLAFDAGPDAPELDEMDKIVASIRPVGDATSGGVGSSIGPR